MSRLFCQSSHGLLQYPSRSSSNTNTTFLLQGLPWLLPTGGCHITYFCSDFCSGVFMCLFSVTSTMLQSAWGLSLRFASFPVSLSRHLKIKKEKKEYLFIYLAVPSLSCGTQDLFLFFNAVCGIFSCGMWDLVPQPRIEPRPPALGLWRLSHWTTRKIPE